MAVDAATEKERGNEAFKNAEFEEAIECYTKAISATDSDHTLFSNRSAAYASLEKYDESLADAAKTVKLKPDWWKGYARLGNALLKLGRLEEAKKAFLRGLEEDPQNASLQTGVREADSELSKKARAAKASDVSPKERRAKYRGVKGYMLRMVNPLGLSTKGAILYTLCVTTAIGMVLLLRVKLPSSNGTNKAEGQWPSPE